MLPSRSNPLVPQLTITLSQSNLSTNNSEISNDVSSNDGSSIVDDIRPLLSPVVSVPDELSTDPTTIDKMMLTPPGEDDDDFLLRSLKSASFSTTNFNNFSSSKINSKRYSDNPNSANNYNNTQPYIFQPTNSNISFLHSTSNLNNGSMNNISSRRPSVAESIVESVIHLKELTLSQLKRRRFFIVSIFSLICIFIFDLIFLPRTSLDRDLRRLYTGSNFLTFDEISRIYLNQLSVKNNVKNYLDLYNDVLHKPGKNYLAVKMILDDFTYLDSDFQEFQVYMGNPVSNSIKLLNSNDDTLFEPIIKESHNQISYFPYSKNSEIKFNYLFVNYGLEDDYDLLIENDINLQNKIFIIRFSDFHPSLIIEKAQKRGAKGILFFNDPYDDGIFTEKNGFKNFPLGLARNHHAIDKFTTNYIYYQPGDPTTPGWSPYFLDNNNKRLSNPENVPKIPVLSLSFKQIEPILSDLNKINTVYTGNTNKWNGNWKGNLNNFDYLPGPSINKLYMKNEIEYKVQPIYNIITTIPGIIEDEEIVIGSSKDVISGYGGISKGESGIFEIARGFNELIKRGWKPLRTIKLIIWDGTSLGNLGSTEFGEYYAQNILNNCIVYINFDDIKGSKLNIESNPLFNKLIEKIMKLILVDEKNTLFENFKMNNNSISLIKEVGDYTIFQNHLGIPSINIGFEKNNTVDPVNYFNSKFDNLQLLEIFDPNIKLHNLLSQFIGLLVINISENEIIHVKSFEYMNLINNKFKDINNLISEDWLKKDMVYPFDYLKTEEMIAKIETELSNVLIKADKFDKNLKRLQEMIKEDFPWFKLFKKIKTAIKIKMFNSKIKAIDKMFISTTNSKLLKNRPWYRHLVFAPSLSKPKTVDVLPGLQEGISTEDFGQYSSNMVALYVALERLNQLL